MPVLLKVEAGSATPLVCELSPAQRAYLGRKRDSTLVLLDQHASRLHAEIYYEDDHWLLRDCGTLNGTKLNGQRINEAVVLNDSAQIAIGDIRLRFSLKEPAEPARLPPDDSCAPSVELTRTALQHDELALLVDFMNDALAETTPRGLLQRALTMVKMHTGADLCGFLSCDPEEPAARVVIPTTAAVDAQLSRRLTQQALQTSRPVWLALNRNLGGESGSLADFSDALCIPLRAAFQAGPGNREAKPQGALHLYRARKAFSDRQVRFCEVLAAYLANSLHLLRARRALEADNARLRDEAVNQDDLLVGDSPAMQDLRHQIARLAERPRVVLITGESGVGKELVALALHQQSSRSDCPLVAVSCAAYATSVLESELFGHPEGAFTGATRTRLGHFQVADEGTLFLDEVGELPLECQAKLLRVLETGTFWPVGADKSSTVDVRVIAATNRDLARDVQAGRFRNDLFYRLGMPILVPPLREHLEDISALAEHFLSKLGEEYHRAFRLSEAALEKLRSYTWPGNVRQLRIVLENAAAMTDGDEITPRCLRLDPEAVPRDRPPSLNLADVERWAIAEVMNQTGGNKTQAARILGINRDTLYRKLSEMNLG